MTQPTVSKHLRHAPDVTSHAIPNKSLFHYSLTSGHITKKATFPLHMDASSYTSQWAAPLPLKLLLPMGDLDLYLMMFHRAHPTLQAKRHLNHSNRPRYSVCNNRPHLRIYTSKMQLNNNNHYIRLTAFFPGQPG